LNPFSLGQNVSIIEIYVCLFLTFLPSAIFDVAMHFWIAWICYAALEFGF